MKNLILIPILLPTDDANQIGSIVSNDDGLLAVVIPYEYGKNMTTEGAGTDNMQVHHLYLCSDLSIKEGNWHIWYLDSGGLLPTVTKYDGKSHIGKDDIKIEFTTDPKLIAEGVLAIDENTKAIVEWMDFPKGGEKDVEVSFLSEFCDRYNQNLEVENFMKDMPLSIDEQIIENLKRKKGFSLDQVKEAIRIAHLYPEWDFSTEQIIQSITKQESKGDIIIECEMEDDSENFGQKIHGVENPQIKLKYGQPILIFR